MGSKEMKRCNLCRESKARDRFHVHNGSPDRLHSRCKQCRNLYYRNYRKKNSIALRSQYKKWRENSKQAQTPRTERGSYCKIKSRVSATVNRAIKSGELIKPNNCSACGSKATGHGLQGHHEDYGKPLEVTWLCVACHCQVHSGALVLT